MINEQEKKFKIIKDFEYVHTDYMAKGKQLQGAAINYYSALKKISF